MTCKSFSRALNLLVNFCPSFGPRTLLATFSAPFPFSLLTLSCLHSAASKQQTLQHSLLSPVAQVVSVPEQPCSKVEWGGCYSTLPPPPAWKGVLKEGKVVTGAYSGSCFVCTSTLPTPTHNINWFLNTFSLQVFLPNVRTFVSFFFFKLTLKRNFKCRASKPILSLISPALFECESF